MKIVTLQGDSNTGKTTILKKAIEKYGHENERVAQNRTFQHSMHTTHTPTGHVPEAWAAYEIGGKRIMIMTVGDTPKLIFNTYEWIKGKAGWDGAEILVCASHTGNEFIDLFEKKFGSQPVVICSTGEYADEKIADLIISEIKKPV